MTELELPLDDVRYVVVDVETTGGTNSSHRMIELGYCVIEDGEIVRRYSSLINPHSEIPDFIAVMTGITQDMVVDAPEEDDVLPNLLRELREEGTVFVGHNVGFDWGFVAKAFTRHGEDVPDIPRLCTCRLSRRISSGLQKHDLGSVATYYGVAIEARHRALGDAEATAHALITMIGRARDEHEAQTLEDLLALQTAKRTTPLQPSKVQKAVAERLAEVPDEPGVYYFLNGRRQIVYIGKAKSLAKRVRHYFGSTPLHNKKLSRMLKYVRDIRWETTETELGAILLESREIKDKQPSYNVMSREYLAPTFLKLTDDDFPRLDLVSSVDDDGGEYYGPFKSERMALRVADIIRQTHKLRTCAGTLRPHADVRPCFEFHVKRCEAPCAELQDRSSYQQNVERARAYLSNPESGVVTHLAQQMEAAAGRMDFERAALLRDGIRDLGKVTQHSTDRPLAVRDTNLVIIVPTRDRYQTVETFILRSGRLRYHGVLGLAATTTVLRSTMTSIFTTSNQRGSFTEQELDELRLITSWLYGQRERSITVHVHVDRIHEAFDTIVAALRDLRQEAPQTSMFNEYSQLPEQG